MTLKIVEVTNGMCQEISVINTRKYTVIKTQIEPDLIIVYVVKK